MDKKGLTTKDFEKLNISFEYFLRYSLMEQEKQKQIEIVLKQKIEEMKG